MENPSLLDTQAIEAKTNELSVNIALHTLLEGKQLLVFNNSKSRSEATAEKIAKALEKVDEEEVLKKLSERILHALSSPTKQCRRLAKVVEKGIAFHHSGLTGKQRTLIEDAFKRGLIKVISSTPTLCLAKSTKVWTGSTRKKIEEIKEENVFALKDQKLYELKPLSVENNGFSEELVEIQSVSGHTIQSTPQHSFYVKRNGIKRLMRADEIEKGDLIATVGKLSLNSISEVTFSDLVKKEKLPFENRELTEEEYYLIGAMLGDGYSGAETKEEKLIYKGSPCIVGQDEEVFTEVYNSCLSLSLSTRRQRNMQGVPQLILGKNNWFREFLVRAGVEKGERKYINEELKKAEKRKLSFLLSGLFDTDGHVEKRGHIGYSSISSELIKDIQFCLYRFNIVSRLRKREKKSIKITDKVYQCKDSYELLIAETDSILKFEKHIGFKIKRKQKTLKEVSAKLKENILSKSCKQCNYTLYKNLFSGRTLEQKRWGIRKKRVVETLSLKGAQTTKFLSFDLGGPIRKNETRLNHHYELIKKEAFGSRDKIWSLNSIGSSITKELKKTTYSEIFKRGNCSLCGEALDIQKRRGWKSSNKEGDIYWDEIRTLRKVKKEEEVYDVVLPSDASNDHLFIAEGFITHNSAGLNMPAYKVLINDYKRYSSRGYQDIPVLEFHQMAGRAGRPGSENLGKAVVLVKDERELERVVPKYIFGEAEEILSKLAVEPTLKMYVLSLVAMDLVNTKEEIKDFFAETLYAHQFQDEDALFHNIMRILDILKDYDFIMQEDEYYMATPLGKKVSELYLNPDTAHYFIEHLDEFIKRFSKQNISRFDIYALIFFVANTAEMRPLFTVSKLEEEHYVARAEDISDTLVVEFNPFEMDYVDFLKTIKISDVMNDWINEAPEDYLNEKFKITPGELHYKLETMDWLLYCLEEVALLKKNFFFRTFLNKLRVRFKSGVKEELLALISLKGIGRARARKLHKAGLRKILDLKRAELATLTRLIGESMAIKVKEQIREEISEHPLDEKPHELSMREVSDEEVETLLESVETFEKEIKEKNKKLNQFF